MSNADNIPDGLVKCLCGWAHEAEGCPWGRPSRERFDAAMQRAEAPSRAVDEGDVGVIAAGVRVLERECEGLRKQKDDAYTERNAVVAALSKLYPSYLALHPDDPEWDAEWRAIVFVETPAGQLSWHLHESHLQMFRHLPWKENRWDGHTTEQKYQRLAAL